LVINTKKIINGEAIVPLAFHDEKDGTRQFLDGFDIDENGAASIILSK